MADSFPVAAPQETQKLPESPDFLAQIERLEAMAANGIETPNGVEEVQFRTGIEVEFAIIDPGQYRTFLSEREESNQRLLAKRLVEYPNNPDGIRKSHEESVENSRAYERSLLLNPDNVEIDRPDTTEVVEDFKQYAADFIGRLPASTSAEEEKRKTWLEQIPSFTAREVINFLLYEEFSQPTLQEVKPPVGGSLDQLDAYADSQGWLEFRFGNGTLQTGYYDNEGMCEIRLAPCPPSEALHRKAVIKDRMLELADQFGVLIQTSAGHEHINLSVYSKTDRGDFVPVIGLDEQRRAKTLDITAGVSEAYAAGLLLHPKNMKYDYQFDPSAGSRIRFAPSRKGVRIMNDLIELRSGFTQADQAVNMLMAGAIDGMQKGHDAIKAEGIPVPEESTIYRVHRQPDFDKAKDLQVQRAFENSTNTDGVFAIDDGYNFIRGGEITQSLLGDENDQRGSDVFNSLIISSVSIDENGIPSVTPEKLQQTFDGFKDFFKRAAEKVMGLNFDEIAKTVNPKLSKVKLEPVTVVAGEARYAVESRDAAYEKLRGSLVAALALGSEVEKNVSWLQISAPTEAAA